ncbi:MULTISPECIES: GTA-gp10 family protein [unclassified Sulfitobacter]|uniref:GTA-gp10 family protein n=1 Tax=unclassified Sulfitobacter TaxID=196795 RepID=UPI0007C20D22|nr:MULTISPECIES: GTA-gp10 family protein [unclassified Sulfitobacter]KZY05272.1 hypothetical protein A3721_15185 [Sulfitobacter sp. HI0023]KZY26832.1 hypothetical protein A3728_14780 [Sulfitobacter sp. HI0040]KZZ62441.1 hypothetical protein A3764_06285 [Sulfitobacter sp. HI0129]
MPITASAPAGGTIEQLGGESRPLVLRNGEIERFERQHNIGFFTVVESLFGKGDAPQVRHCRDLIALGLVGGGLPDRTADKIVDDLPPHENPRIRSMAMDLVGAIYLSEEDKKKDAELAGSSPKTGRKATTRKRKSKAQSLQD